MVNADGTNAIIRLFRRHRRSCAILYACCLLAIVIIMMNTRLRKAFLYRIETGISYFDDRWTRRLEHGERLVSTRQYDAAVSYLERLDRVFPADNVRHKRDRERERLLSALGRAYSATSRKARTLDVYRQLVAFDSRNYANHHQLALACEVFHEPAEAFEHVMHILAIHPTHLPSVRFQLEYYLARAQHSSIVEAFEAYLDVFLLHEITVSLGGAISAVEVPVDGRFHSIQLSLSKKPAWSGLFELDTNGLLGELAALRLNPPLYVGIDHTERTSIWAPSGGWQIAEAASADPTASQPLDSASAFPVEVPSQPSGVEMVHLTLRLFKPLDAEISTIVDSAYRNLVDDARYHNAQERSGMRPVPPLASSRRAFE